MHDLEKIELPATLKLSFELLLDSLRERANIDKGGVAKYYENLLTKVAEYPELVSGIEEADLENYREIIDELLGTIFPYALKDNEIKGVSVPWKFEPFYTSDRLKSIIRDSGGHDSWEHFRIDQDSYYIAACSAILGMHYGWPVNISRPFFAELQNEATGRVRSYRVGINADFMKLEPTAEAPEITVEDYHELIDNFHDIDLWKRKFPPKSWMFSGFTVVNMMDLTDDQRLRRIVDDLLGGDHGGYENFQKHLGELFETEDLEASFVAMKDKKFYQLDLKPRDSMMMGGEIEICPGDLLCDESLELLIGKGQPIAFPNVDKHEARTHSRIAKNLQSAGIKSFFVSPITYEGETLGILELGSRTKGLLNATTQIKLERILPFLAVAANRMISELSNRVEAIIQEECTTIHPSVKWRFAEEALESIKADAQGLPYQWKDISFKGVHPLYGQLDIRNSSSIRNEAIRSDLLSQLLDVQGILNEALQLAAFPAYEELLFVANGHIANLKDNMITSSEQVILKFLNTEVEPVLEHLYNKYDRLRPLIDKYRNSLHHELHFVYEERQAFDDSVDRINRHMADYLDRKQIDAQAMFPHYYERYKTDGLEFNMYIGESISRSGGFSELMVKNLRLWQMMVMVEMEREVHKLHGEIKMKLEVASLILAYSTSLAINFRMDEKHFDVEGAYNARYEIVKKRIDKAYIKGTKERITAVGKLVIVYTRDEDEAEYMRYISFLQSNGYLEPRGHEVVQVEDLPGVSGLKAIRADIAYEPDKESITLSEIMEEISETR